MNKQFRRILIVRTDRIGDVILTLPVAQVLKKHCPDAHIAMLIRRYTAELVDGNPSVNQTLFYDDGERLLPFFSLVDSLRTQKFDIVVHTYPRFRLALMTWLAGIPVRVGTGFRWYSLFFNRKVYEHRSDAKRHELEYNLNLLKALDPTIDTDIIDPKLEVHEQTEKKIKALLTELGVQQHQRIVVLHPGSGGSARDWSSSKFGELGRELSQISNIKIIITGGKNEQSLVDDVKRIVGESALALVDRLSLKEYAALAKLASLFIANSTGPLHIAAAVGTPVIGLYPQVTALSARRWSPITEKKIIFTPIDKPADCKRCVVERATTCECMESITVQEVCAAAKQALGLN